MFRLPLHPDKIYPPVGACIYCGATESLSDEHIIPLGLGGRWVLPKSSCLDCAKKTGAFERTCQRTMLGPLRMYFDLPTRRKKERPKKLPLKVKLTPNADWSFIDVDQERYPFLVLFPLLPMPDELSGHTTSGERGAAARTLWVRAASFRDGIMPHLQELATELSVAAIEPTAEFRAPEFFRMVAKIAHAFAVAEMGVGSFIPFLTPMICGADTSNSVQWVGGLPRAEPAVGALHELSFSSSDFNRPDVISVRIRLLAALETPTYFVAVGRRAASTRSVSALGILAMDKALAELSILRRFIDFVNQQVGVYCDCLAGFEGNKVRVERQVARVLRPVSRRIENGQPVIMWASVEDPGSPDVIHHRIIRTDEFLAANSETGFNEQQVCWSIIVFIFAFWDEEIRPRIAEIRGVAANEVRVDALGDLRILRKSIVHNNGVIVAREHAKLKKLAAVCKPDEKLAFTHDQMHTLFVAIKSAIAGLMLEYTGHLSGAPKAEEIVSVAVQNDHRA